MNLEELLQKHRDKKPQKVNLHGLRRKAYQRHYPLIKDAVLNGVPLLAAIKILREDEGAFKGITDAAVWIAYSRALKSDGVTMGGKA
jgi:hypothetical protein